MPKNMNNIFIIFIPIHDKIERLHNSLNLKFFSERSFRFTLEGNIFYLNFKYYDMIVK